MSIKVRQLRGVLELNRAGVFPRRRDVGRWAFAAVSTWLAGGAVVRANTPNAWEGLQATALSPARSLADELVKALAKNRPLVVMVSLQGCPYCKIVRENYLLPLVRQDTISVVQIDMHAKTSVKDFQGGASTYEQLIDKWEIRIAPTLLFFGRGGQEKAERLVGGYLPDFYGAYLQERLGAAQKFL